MLVRVDRAADVLHLALEQLGELDVEIGLLLGAGSTAAWRCNVSISSLQLPRLRCSSAMPPSAPVCAGIDAQRLLHRVDRVLEVREVLAVPAADLHPQIRGRAAILALELVDALGVLVEQLLPAVGRRGEPLELVRGLVVRVVALERGLQHVERALLIADLALVDLRDRG